MLPDVHKQDWRQARDDRHEIEGIICAAVVGLCFWAVVIGWWVS